MSRHSDRSRAGQRQPIRHKHRRSAGGVGDWTGMGIAIVDFLFDEFVGTAGGECLGIGRAYTISTSLRAAFNPDPGIFGEFIDSE